MNTREIVDSLNIPYIVLTDTNISLVSDSKSGWISSVELHSIGQHDRSKVIDANGNLYNLLSVKLGALKLLSPLHIFNFIPLRRAPRVVEFQFECEAKLNFDEAKRFICDHIEKFRLLADPDPGGGRGKYYIRDQVVLSKNYSELFAISELAMSRNYMKTFYHD